MSQKLAGRPVDEDGNWEKQTLRTIRFGAKTVSISRAVRESGRVWRVLHPDRNMPDKAEFTAAKDLPTDILASTDHEEHHGVGLPLPGGYVW